MGKLEGKVALITGGSDGIGFAAAKRLAAEGAYVFITGRRKAELEAAAKELGGSGEAIQSDASKLDELDRVFATIKAKKGHLDIVFANAAAAKKAKLGEITEEQFDREFGTNVKGVLFTVQKALPLLRDGASIILNASIVASKGLGDVSVYSATKAALRSFVRTWTTDLRGRNIRVNAVSPGFIDTAGLQGLNGASSEQLSDHLASLVPIGRVGRPDDIAKAIVFLASDDSSYVAGAELFVDGGFAQV